MLPLKRLYHWLFPNTCLLCKTLLSGERLCVACYKHLPWQINYCCRCGEPLTLKQLCGRCLTKPPPYHNIIYLFRYESPVDWLILSLKFADKLNHAQLLGELLAEKLFHYYQTDTKPECIIPVPLHPQRLKERGYNQAIEIARPIGKRLKIPCDLQYCQRIVATPPQTVFNAHKRKTNIKHAFMITSTWRANHVAIVDDVLTTGSTVAEMTKTLQKSGVKRVDIWCCAKTKLLLKSLR